MGPTYRLKFAKLAARISVSVNVIVLTTRPLFVEMHDRMFYIALCSSLLAIAVWWLIETERIKEMGSSLVIFISFMTVTLLGFLTGGIHSHYMFFMPLYPLLSSLLIGSRGLMAMTISALLSTISMLLFAEKVPTLDQQFDHYNTDTTTIRAYWICASITLASVVGHFCHTINKNLSRRLQQQVFFDPTTKILNRRGINKRSLQAVEDLKEQSGWLTIIMADLDYFKAYNDTYGHMEGDECLADIAIAMHNCIKPYPAHIGRFGGEEFMIIIETLAPDEAKQIAELLRSNIEQLNLPHRGSPANKLTMSIGLCSASVDHDFTLNQVIANADTALYKAKEQGRNKVVSYESISSINNEKFAL